MFEESTDIPERRGFAAEVRAAGEGDDSNELEGTVVTRTRNSYGEIFVPGAFANSLKRMSDRRPLVLGWLHVDPIGRWHEAEERKEDGIFARGKVSDTALGRDALTLVRDGAITGLSIGFYLIAEQFVPDGTEVSFDTPFGKWTHQEDAPTFYITEADVVEASLVMVPADDEARVDRAADRLVRELPALAEEPTDATLERTRSVIDGGRLSKLPLVRQRSIEQAVARRREAAEERRDGDQLEAALAGFKQAVSGSVRT